MTPARVHIDDQGTGRPVVLLHGYLCSSRWFEDVAALLSGRYRVIRIDLYGHGRTGGTDGLDSPDQARMVARVLDDLDLEDAVVVGHSFGADVAVDVAGSSSRVVGLVIMAQAPDYSYARFPVGTRLLTLPLVGRLLKLIPSPRLFRPAMTFGFAPGYRIPADLVALGYADFKAACPRLHRVVLVDRAKRLAAAPLDRLAKQSGVPAMAILGELDKLYDATRTSARYDAAGLQVEVVRGSGHSPMIENPQRVAALLDGFVSPSR